MKIKEYLYPSQVVLRLREYIKIIGYRKKYENILSELDRTKKLEEAGFLKKENYLLIGVNLNEQLLTYDDLTN